MKTHDQYRPNSCRASLAFNGTQIGASAHECPDEVARRLRIAMLLESIIDAIPSKKCRRTIRALWRNQWDKKETAKDLGVSEKAILVALFRFKKAAAQIATAPEFQDAYECIFC
jgi:hypothetical protein